MPRIRVKVRVGVRVLILVLDGIGIASYSYEHLSEHYTSDCRTGRIMNRPARDSRCT